MTHPLGTLRSDVMPLTLGNPFRPLAVTGRCPSALVPMRPVVALALPRRRPFHRWPSGPAARVRLRAFGPPVGDRAGRTAPTSEGRWHG